MASGAAGSEIDEFDTDALARRFSTDIAAFTELYQRFLCPVYRFIRARTPDDATAEDLTAQVFFKVLRSAATFRGEGSFDAWIFRIARNSLATWRAARAREAIAVGDVPESPDPAPSPVTRLIEEEEKGFVRTTLECLPPAQRQAVALRYLKDLSVREIATATKRTPGAVRILLHRARAKLRKTIQDRAR